MPRTAASLNQDEAQAYTLHSLKEALLGASAQLRLPEESRHQQGHHRLTSVQLCSRDDTIESFWVQSQIASALIRGWRPTRPRFNHGPARMQFSNPRTSGSRRTLIAQCVTRLAARIAGRSAVLVLRNWPEVLRTPAMLACLFG